VGVALHNTAAAIVTYFAVAKAGAWINTGQTFGWVLNGQWSGHGAQIAVSAALWIALPLTLGTVRTIRREVLLSERAVVPVSGRSHYRHRRGRHPFRKAAPGLMSIARGRLLLIQPAPGR
jgi:hypothetical protein